MAIICSVVLNLANTVTGTLTLRAGQEFAKAGHQDFAGENDQRRNQPEQSKGAHDQVELVNGMFGDQHHQRHGDEDLVGDGIEHSPELRSGIELACGEPIQRIAYAGDAEHGESCQACRIAGQNEGKREHRHQNDSHDGEYVGQREHGLSLAPRGGATRPFS